jgi:hypothetical protein
VEMNEICICFPRILNNGSRKLAEEPFAFADPPNTDKGIFITIIVKIDEKKLFLILNYLSIDSPLVDFFRLIVTIGNGSNLLIG